MDNMYVNKKVGLQNEEASANVLKNNRALPIFSNV